MTSITVQRDVLLLPLQSVSGVVERRHTLPILSNVLLEIQKTFDFFKATAASDRIDRILLSGGACAVDGFRTEIRLEYSQNRSKDRHAGQPELTAFLLERCYEIFLEKRVQDQTRRFGDLRKRMVELFL